jgi:hypothetical protein
MDLGVENVFLRDELAEARAKLAAIEKRCFEELALLDAEQIIEEEEQKLA